MKILLITLLFPFSVIAQNKAEAETNDCIENYIKNHGESWNEIQNSFEEYLISSDIQKKGESVEQGYLNYIKLRQRKIVLPPISNRNKLKALLKKSEVLPSENKLAGKPLINCVDKVFNKYKADLSNTQAYWKLKVMCRLITSANPEYSSQMLAEKYSTFLNIQELNKLLYKKVIILSLFVDAIYLDELFCKEVSKDNPHKNDLEYREIDDLKVGEPIPDSEVRISEVESIEEGEEEEIFLLVEYMPKFPGGELGLRKNIAQSIKYPKEAVDKKLKEKFMSDIVYLKQEKLQKFQLHEVPILYLTKRLCV